MTSLPEYHPPQTLNRHWRGRKSTCPRTVDNKPVTTFAYNRATDSLAYTAKTLRPGRHTVKIAATDAQRKATTRIWSFTVGV